MRSKASLHLSFNVRKKPGGSPPRSLSGQQLPAGQGDPTLPPAARHCARRALTVPRHSLAPALLHPSANCQGRVGEQLTWVSAGPASAGRGSVGATPPRAWPQKHPTATALSRSRSSGIGSTGGCRDLRKFVGEVAAAAQAARPGRKERVSRSATLEEGAFLQKRKWVSKAVPHRPVGVL